jgi:hypothetical protein
MLWKKGRKELQEGGSRDNSDEPFIEAGRKLQSVIFVLDPFACM